MTGPVDPSETGNVDLIAAHRICCDVVRAEGGRAVSDGKLRDALNLSHVDADAAISGLCASGLLTRVRTSNPEWKAWSVALSISNLSAPSARYGDIGDKLLGLFGERNRQRRGKALEGVLNGLFLCDSILVREAFCVVKQGHGTVEQIDGAIELDGTLYLVEMKW